MVRLLALALLCAAPASAAVAPSAPVPSFEAGVAAGLAAIKAAAPHWTSVDMLVGGGPGFVTITEPALHVDVTGTLFGAGWLSGRAGTDSVGVSVAPFGTGWSLMGSGVDVTMSRFGEDWSVWGSAGKTQLNYRITRFGSSVDVFGQSGANVHVSGWSRNLQVYGQIDEARVDAKALAVLGATLALASPAAK